MQPKYLNPTPGAHFTPPNSLHPTHCTYHATQLTLLNSFHPALSSDLHPTSVDSLPICSTEFIPSNPTSNSTYLHLTPHHSLHLFPCSPCSTLPLHLVLQFLLPCFFILSHLTFPQLSSTNPCDSSHSSPKGLVTASGSHCRFSRLYDWHNR